MPVKVYPDLEMLSWAAACLFVDIAVLSVQSRGKFSVSLSGGSSPRRVYEILASPPFRNRVPWKQTFVFWGDERFVPANDPENNAGMARELLLDHVPIPSNHIFPIPTTETPKAAAKCYASTLEVFFKAELPRFDLILLGLGENGHTASLFPGKDVLKEKLKWVAPVFLEDKAQRRITLTVPVINNAKNIVFIVNGGSKAEVLSRVLKDHKQPEKLPAQLVNPHKGSLYWYVDTSAGRLLKEENEA